MLQVEFTVSDLFGDLVYGEEIFFIQDAVSEGIPKASQQNSTYILGENI